MYSRVKWAEYLSIYHLTVLFCQFSFATAHDTHRYLYFTFIGTIAEHFGPKLQKSWRIAVRNAANILRSIPITSFTEWENNQIGNPWTISMVIKSPLHILELPRILRARQALSDTIGGFSQETVWFGWFEPRAKNHSIMFHAILRTFLFGLQNGRRRTHWMAYVLLQCNNIIFQRVLRYIAQNEICRSLQSLKYFSKHCQSLFLENVNTIS